METLRGFLEKKAWQASQFGRLLKGNMAVKGMESTTGIGNHRLSLVYAPKEERAGIPRVLNARGVQARASWVSDLRHAPLQGF